MGKDYGVILLPEGLIEFVPEFNRLIVDINEVLSAGKVPLFFTSLSISLSFDIY